jgi:hypothetical protein
MSDFDVDIQGEYLFDIGTSEHTAIMYFSARSVIPPGQKGFYNALYLFDEGNSDNESKAAHKLLKEAASSGESQFKGLTLAGESNVSFEFYSAVGETALTLAPSSSVRAKLTFLEGRAQKDTTFIAQLQIGHDKEEKILKIPFLGTRPGGSRLGKVKRIAANDTDRLDILNNMGSIKRPKH